MPWQGTCEIAIVLAGQIKMCHVEILFKVSSEFAGISDIAIKRNNVSGIVVQLNSGFRWRLRRIYASNP